MKYTICISCIIFDHCN